jgi:integrase
MAIHKLRPRWIETVKKDGTYADGGDLYLQVKHNGRAKSWIFRYMINGRPRSMGLGPLHTISLAEARDRARSCRQQRLDGIDPIEARKRARLDQEMARAKEVRFRDCALGWMAVQEIGWSPGRTTSVRRRFEKYVFPKIGDLPVQRLDAEAPDAVRLLHDVLTQEIRDTRFGYPRGSPKPLWTGFYKTGQMLREDIEGALNWAHAKRHIRNPNAASLTGPLGQLLAKAKNFYQLEHHAALPFKEAGQFMANLRTAEKNKYKGGLPSNSALLLQFLLLAGVRKHQAVEAKWQDLDLEDKIWICSNHKTKKKTGQDYIVPLSRQAIAVIEDMRKRHQRCGIEIKPDDYIFPGRANGHISSSALNSFLKRTLKRKDITIHGFRTAFGDWSVEFGFDEGDSEMALGHVVGNTVRNIYKRNAARIEPRRQMMQAWADYLDQVEPLPASVTNLGQFKAGKKQDQAS